MDNRNAIISFTLLMAIGVSFSVPNSPWWASVCLFMASLFFLVASFSFYKKIQQLSNTHFPEKKLAPFTTLRKMNEKINEQEEKFQLITMAVENIGNGKSATSFQLDGTVGAAVEKLQARLATLKEEEARTAWAAQGLAKLSEIRKNEENLTEYAYQVISQLVKYLGANQGAFYIMEGEKAEDYTLKLLTTYAYGKRKFQHQEVTINAGEGLLGQCVLEKEMIFMKQVPKDYVKITSGLGEATPRCIILIPLIFKDHAYGVIEIASFQILEQYQLDFLKKVSEGLAAEFSVIKTHEHTKNLLESSQTLTTELRAQEEEMRQNMEELNATQEEMARKMDELQKLKRVDLERKKNEAILNGCMDGVISFNDKGVIEFANTAALEIFGRSHSELMGKEISQLLDVRIAENTAGVLGVISNTGNEVKMRAEVTTVNSKAEEIALLLTATSVEVEGRSLFTLFIQNISVEIF